MPASRRLRRFSEEVASGGIVGALKKTAKHVAFRAAGQREPVHDRRMQLYEKFATEFDETIKYGPFRGMKLNAGTSWHGAYRVSILFGLYEQELLELLPRLPNAPRVFVDVGAADGYYAIGALLAGWADKTYCFEISEEGRRLIHLNSTVNGVADKVIIHGRADNDFYRKIPAENLRGAVVLVDIEGAEFDIFSKMTFEELRYSTIIIEIHDWIENGHQRVHSLIGHSASTHTVSTLRTSGRDPGQFDELKALSDTDRWLICSEDRPKLMEWLRFDPLSERRRRKVP